MLKQVTSFYGIINFSLPSVLLQNSEERKFYVTVESLKVLWQGSYIFISKTDNLAQLGSNLVTYMFYRLKLSSTNYIIALSRPKIFLYEWLIIFHTHRYVIQYFLDFLNTGS